MKVRHLAKALDTISIDIPTVFDHGVSARSRAFAGTFGIGIAIEIGIADIRASGASGCIFLRVGSGAGIERENDLMTQSNSAMHVASAIRGIARPKRVGPMPFTDLTIGNRDQFRIQAAGGASCHDALLDQVCNVNTILGLNAAAHSSAYRRHFPGNRIVIKLPAFKGSGTLIAQDIRARIAKTVGITASAGVAPNKFLSKIASDWNKPDGMFVIRPHEIDAFVAVLPVEKLFGVGKVTAAKLKRLGAHHCADLRNWSVGDLRHHFGKFGERLFDLCRGIDKRAVCSTRERKSISVEETYVIDLPDIAACAQQLAVLIESLAGSVRRLKSDRYITKLFVKIRFDDFRKTTAECVSVAIDQVQFYKLLDTGFQRGQRPVRLLGVGVRLDEDEDDLNVNQLGLFGGDGDPSSGLPADAVE